MARPFLAFHIHSGHVPRHLHLLGGKYLRGSENSCSRENILQKPSPATHAFFLSRSNDRISKSGLVMRNTECRRKCTEAPSTSKQADWLEGFPRYEGELKQGWNF